MRSLAGTLLVATPVLTEPTFHRTVILLIADEVDGAIGLVLNRPSSVPVAGVLPEWAALATEPASVFTGGPVAPEAAVCLARNNGRRADAWTPIAGGALGTLDLTGSAEELAGTVGALRLFAGYAGWGAGQLKAEIASDAWVTLTACDEDPFSPHPATLWRSVLRRQTGLVAAMANYPADPLLN